MAKQNLVFLCGFVTQDPIVFKNKEGEMSHGIMYLDTVRSLRKVGDNLHYQKHDYPLIICRNPELLPVMDKMKEYDIILLKGVVTTTSMPKTSYCPSCGEKNLTTGNCVYVTPIYMEKIASCPDKKSATDYILERQEISNQVYIYGTLLHEPKIFTTKRGKQVTQYPIVIDRKFTIRADDPVVKSDYPVVKSYGEQARNDKTYLKAGSEVIVDGGLQARNIERNAKCPHCGSFYKWKDTAMEIVTYACEYLNGFKSDADIEKEFQMDVEAYKQKLFGQTDALPDELKTMDLAENE